MNDLQSQLQSRQANQDAQRAIKLPGFVQYAREVSADFTLRIDTAEQLCVVLAAIGGHNNYVPPRASKVLGKFVSECMQVSVEHFVGGPAIYFQIPYTQQQQLKNRHGGSAVRFSDEERAALTQQIIDAGKELGADEITVRQQDQVASIVVGKPGDRPYEVRLWWD